MKQGDEMKTTRTRTVVGFLVGIVLGAAVWWAAPHVVGKTEPWDAVSYYAVALFVTGMLGALVDPRRFWIPALGIYVGQFLYEFLFLPGGALWFAGLIFGALYLLIALFGGLIVRVLWQFGQRRKAAGS